MENPPLLEQLLDQSVFHWHLGWLEGLAAKKHGQRFVNFESNWRQWEEWLLIQALGFWISEPSGLKPFTRQSPRCLAAAIDSGSTPRWRYVSSWLSHICVYPPVRLIDIPIGVVGNPLSLQTRLFPNGEDPVTPDQPSWQIEEEQLPPQRGFIH